MPFRLGIIEIILILVIFFIIFGAGRLPQLFEMVGKGVRALSGRKKSEETEEVKTTKRTRKGSGKS
jgi:TatA/E family protein of Tat protein translocase